MNFSLSAPQHLKNLRLQCKNLWFLQTLWERHTPGDDAPRAFCSAVNLALIKYLCFPVDLLTLFSSLAFLPPSLWRQSPHCTASPPHIYSSSFLFPCTRSLPSDLSSFLTALSAFFFLYSFMFSLINNNGDQFWLNQVEGVARISFSGATDDRTSF